MFSNVSKLRWWLPIFVSPLLAVRRHSAAVVATCVCVSFIFLFYFAFLFLFLFFFVFVFFFFVQ